MSRELDVSQYSTYLFAMPSWAEGVGRLIDFGNTLTQYNDSASGAQADANALENDMRAIADDLRRALRAAVAEK